jgi:hypothetical protein
VFTKPAPGKPDPGGYSPTALVFLEFSRRLGKAPKLT